MQLGYQYPLKFTAVNEGVKEEGCTPLMVAASYGNIDIVKDLLQHGADPRMKTSAGNTASDDARDGGFTDLAKLIDDYPTIQLIAQITGNVTAELQKQLNEILLVVSLAAVVIVMLITIVVGFLYVKCNLVTCSSLPKYQLM
ncbi:unnamed protein product [Meganyctiphanes norvegica]|uniref:Uncharacterized protein n=2 Tax=Meganyctiphanes norvegica TaxID=48144 RepID=A0AAV2S181_MEGNR